MGKNKSWIVEFLPLVIVSFVAILCGIFIATGQTTENGGRTLDGRNAKIDESTTEWIEDQREALARIMNRDAPTDPETTAANETEAAGKGFSTTIDAILSRRLQDGNNDNGAGWQCSRYTAWLATGQWSYSSAHPDYGPVNGKDVAAWLVRYYGFKYIDNPVEGAIGSGGFNTTYGHTVMYLYATGTNTAMVNDANFVPLTVATHNMNIDGYVWVVPGDYNPAPQPTPTPTPAPQPGDELTYSYVPGDTFGQVLIRLGLDEGRLWGTDGTVMYYTQQLIEQGALTERGYVRLHYPFTLKRR